MAAQLEAAETDIERTAELPVLTEETMIRLGAAEVSLQSATSLETSLEELRQTLDDSEKRWRGLESRLNIQNHAIEELLSAMGKPEGEPDDTNPGANAIAAPANPSSPETGSDAASGSLELALLERILMLENDIEGRADRWQEMERKLAEKTLKISELEHELEQRIQREQHLEGRLRDEDKRFRLLRLEFSRMARNRDTTAYAPVSDPNEVTQEFDLSSQHQPEPEIPVVLQQPPDAAFVDASRPEKHAELTCLSSELHERYAITKPMLTIGRSLNCDINILAHNVSRVHATIQRNDSEIVIKDQSSTNGVFVNAIRVTSKALTDGDEITIGDTQFRFLTPTSGG